MLRKIFTIFILVILAAIGLFAIRVLSKRLENRSTKVGGSIEVSPNLQENKGISQLREAFNFTKANDVSVGKVPPGNLITIEKVILEEAGFVVIYRNDRLRVEDVLGFSQLLPKGETKNITIIPKRTIQEGETLYIGLRVDDGDRFFDYTARFDKHVSRADGKPILWRIEVK